MYLVSLSRFRNGINIFFFPSFLTAGCEFSVPIRARFACCCNRGGFSSPSSYPDRGNSRRNYHSLKERKENPEVAVAKNTVYRPPAGGVEEDESLGSFFFLPPSHFFTQVTRHRRVLCYGWYLTVDFTDIFCLFSTRGDPFAAARQPGCDAQKKRDEKV